MKSIVMKACALTALVAVPLTAAYAAGLWPGLPLVGGAAVCSSTSTGVSGQVCTTTTPAGPSIVTGNETVPADTNLSQGRAPQSVRIGMASLNALPVSFVTGSTTAANALSATTIQGGVIFVASGAMSPTTVTLPPSPVDGQQFAISSNQTIASLTVNSTADTVSNAPTALTVSATAAYGYQFKYRASNSTWYRMQ